MRSRGPPCASGIAERSVERALEAGAARATSASTAHVALWGGDGSLNLHAEVVRSLAGTAIALVERDGGGGRERALAEPFDLILLDIQLPKMNGIDVCRKPISPPSLRAVVHDLDGPPSSHRPRAAGRVRPAAR